ncbi:MAG: HlyC/CorC family transporter [Clostridia bacterium]|nr:HlyC/CorC family transporter [Clostridia bacterium]
MNLVGPLILQVFLIVLNAIFASSEIAIVSTNKAVIEKLAEEKNRRAKMILSLTQNPSKFLSTIQVSITLSALLGSAYAADSFSQPLVDLIMKTGINIDADAIQNLCVLLITIILSFFSIVFGELVPKRMAMKNPQKTALSVVPLLYVVSIIFKPFVWILTKTTNGILKLLRINPDEQEGGISEEELRTMLHDSSTKGEIDTVENQLIQNVFEFDDISVSEICTHRKDVAILYADDSFSKWKKTISSTRHSFYPVCGENADDVLGILNIKRFFRIGCQDIETSMAKAMEKPYFVPESMKADMLFAEMKESRNYYAVVVDEYGGTTGVVTMHDLLEVLVGDLSDKDDVLTVDIKALEENKFLILGSASLEDVEKELDVDLGESEYETFGGYIMGILGTIPDDGSKLELETEELNISVTSINEHRIEKTIVSKKERAEDTEEE